MVKYFLYPLFFLMLCFIACKNENEQSQKTLSNTNTTVSKIVPIRNAKASIIFPLEMVNGKVKSIKKITSHAKATASGIKKVAEGNSYETQYDEQGNIIARAYYNSAKKLQTETSYELDANKVCRQAKLYNANKTLLRTIQFIYDANGKLKEEKHVSPSSKVVARHVYTYNANGQLVDEMKYEGANTLDMKMTYSYNAKGDVVRTKFYHPANTVLIDCTTTYESYDAQGNWLKAVERTNKGSVFLVERVLSYYP